MLSETPERAAMPPEMVCAYVGALAEIARTRLRRGKEAELPTLIDDLSGMFLAYEPPPEPLRLSARRPASGPETLEAYDHAERALRAFAMVVAEQGYANTTIDEVVKRASMSATTFYANFQGKEDAMLAAIDSAGAQMMAAILPAFRRSPDWRQRGALSARRALQLPLLAPGAGPPDDGRGLRRRADRPRPARRNPAPAGGDRRRRPPPRAGDAPGRLRGDRRRHLPARLPDDRRLGPGAPAGAGAGLHLHRPSRPSSAPRRRARSPTRKRPPAGPCRPIRRRSGR